MSDGTYVTPEIQSFLDWSTGRGVTPTEMNKCVAFQAGKLHPVACDGYSDGAATPLGYICEARAVETTDRKNTCVFPFEYMGKTYDGCAQPMPTVASDNQPFCAVKVNKAANNALVEIGVCMDVKRIGYDGAAQGQYCGIPFLMNDQYFETCTKHKQLPDGINIKEAEYWCPSPLGVDKTTLLWNLTGETALCNEYFFPPDNGCPDHYEPVDQFCVRVSPVQKTFAEAKEICEHEGSKLLEVTSKALHLNLSALLNTKMKKYSYYLKPDYYWMGASPIEGSKRWRWQKNPFDMEAAFSNWRDNMISVGCPNMQCTAGEHGLVMKANGLFNWLGDTLTKKHGYICQSQCQKGFGWHDKLGKCVMLKYGRKKETTLPKAQHNCHSFGGKLMGADTCQDLSLIRESVLFEEPKAATYDLMIGLFSNGLQKATERKRSATFDQLIDSYGLKLLQFILDRTLLRCNFPVGMGTRLIST